MTTTHRTSLNGMVAQAVARERRERADKRWKTAGRWLAEATAVLAAGWLLMLGVGVIRHDWIHTCPTVAYPPAVLLAALTSALARMLRLASGGRP